MKYACIVFIILSLLLSMTGCQFPSVDEDTLATLTSELDQFLPNQNTTVHTPLYSVSLPVVTDKMHADDGQELFQYTYQNISLTIPNPEIADRIILDFLNRIDATTQTADQLKSDAKKAYQPEQPWTPYLCSILYTPSRIDSAIFSLYGAYSTYSGAPHPETAYRSITYDMLTGSCLTLQDILTQSVDADMLASLIIAQLQQSDDTNLYEGYENTVRSRFTNLEDNGWYLSNKGLCIYFSPYEIASYAAGKIVVEIPYENLTGVLKDAYFPTEQQTPTGTVSLSAFQADKASEFTQISEVILCENGEKQLLQTDGIVYNVKLEVGTFLGEAFQPEATVYLSNSLTATDAVMLEYQFNDQIALRISYTGQNGETEIYFPETQD